MLPPRSDRSAGVSLAVARASRLAVGPIPLGSRPAAYFPDVTDFKYATTAFASASLMRNGIIGKRNCFPFVQMPVVSSLIISASLAGGFPPILGAIMGQALIPPLAGDHGTGAPCNHLLRSRLPSPSRGVWHCPHIATPSTRYLPRATSPPLSEAPFAAGALRACPYAGRAPVSAHINAKKSPNVPRMRAEE